MKRIICSVMVFLCMQVHAMKLAIKHEDAVQAKCNIAQMLEHGINANNLEEFIHSPIKKKFFCQKEENVNKEKPEKKDCLEGDKSLSTIPYEVFLQCAMTDDLFTTIKNLLVLGQTSRDCRARVLTRYCCDEVAKKFNGNPVSIGVALGNFTQPEYAFESKRIILGKYENAKEEAKIYTDENNISGLIALLKCGFNLWNYYFVDVVRKGNASGDILFKDETKIGILKFVFNAYKNKKNKENPLLAKAISPRCSLSFIQCFIDNGADVNKRNESESLDIFPQGLQSPLEKAAYCGRVDIIELLMQNGASMPYEVRQAMLTWVAHGYNYSYNYTLSRYASEEQLNKTLNYILILGINVNEQLYGGPVLFNFINCGYVEGVRLVLARGVDPLLTYYGRTALDYAREHLRDAQRQEQRPGQRKKLTTIISLLESYAFKHNNSDEQSKNN